jgi:hypothetical protein
MFVSLDEKDIIILGDFNLAPNTDGKSSHKIMNNQFLRHFSIVTSLHLSLILNFRELWHNMGTVKFCFYVSDLLVNLY